MHNCASILDSIAMGISLFPRSFTLCIPSLHPQLNDFCTCIYLPGSSQPLHTLFTCTRINEVRLYACTAMYY